LWKGWSKIKGSPMDQDNMPDLETIKKSRDVGFLMIVVENSRWSDAEKGAELRRCAKLTLEGLRGSPEAEAVIRDLRSEDDRARTGAIFAAGMIGDGRAIEPLLAIMRNLEEYEDNWSYAGQSLGMIGDDGVVPALEEMLLSGEFMIVDGASIALGRLGERGVDALIRALHNADPDVRSSAALNLGDSKNPRAVGPLIRVLRDKSLIVRIDAIMSLGRLGDERAWEPLMGLLEDPDSKIRGYAIRAMGRWKREEAADMLKSLIRSEDPEVRLAAADTLLEVGADMPREVILNTLRDPERSVRRTVALALKATHRPGVIAIHQPLGGMQWRPENREEEIAYAVAAENWEECIGFGEEAIDPLMAIYPCAKDCDTAIADALMRIIQKHPVDSKRRMRVINLLVGKAARRHRRRAENGEDYLC
jgi:HEAT repeat protein